MDRVRDLVAAGGVAVVLAQDRDRFAREPAYHYILKKEFEEHGTAIRALNDRGDGSPEGELTDGIIDQIARFERLKTAERTRRGKLQRAREGKILPVRRVKYGFDLNATRDGYVINEEQMATAGRIFHMVGVQGMSHNAIKRTFEREGIPTPGGGKHWDHSFFRDSVLSDLYRPHAYEEVEAVVSPEVASRLDKSKHYGLWWFNRLKTKTKQVSEPSENGRIYRRETSRSVNPKEEWIAVPVPDSGIPREIVDAARERIKENRTPSRAGRRFWELSGGIIYCGGCARRMGHHSVLARSKKYHYHYYRCPAHNQHVEDCPQDKNIRADEIETAVWDLVSGLLMDPDRLAAGLEEMIDREREELRGDPDQQAKAWADKLADVGMKRAKFQDMAAEGLITFDELREKLAQLDELRKVAEWELSNLEHRRERIAQLEEDKTSVLEDFAGIMPEAVATLTGERRQRIYNLLRLRVTVGVDGDVEVSGAIGEDFCIVGDQR